MLDADIIIAGAGLAGAATAYHLRELGLARVILLEQEAVPGMHASGRNAALVRERADDDPAWQPLASEGAPVLRRGEWAPFRRVGSFLLGAGAPSEQRPVAARVPVARGSGLFTPADGVVDVAALLRFYLRGQDVRLETRVDGWHDGGPHGGLTVETSRGALTAGVLVNAAGPWAGRLGGRPLEPRLRHLFVTAPSPEVDPDWPFVWDVARGLYFRPESGGLLVCACDESAAEPGDYTERWSVLAELVEKANALQPGLRAITGDFTLQHHWAGQRTFAPDGLPVIGHDPRDPRLFWVAGLGGHGVTCSPAVGRLAAELLRAGPGCRAPFGPERLAGPRRPDRSERTLPPEQTAHPAAAQGEDEASSVGAGGRPNQAD